MGQHSLEDHPDRRTPDEWNQYAKQIADVVIDVYDYWREHPVEQHADPDTTVRRSAPKVGRNDPCPCGSGKKFKLCHGTGGSAH